MTSDLSSALEVCINEMHYTNRRILYFTLLYFCGQWSYLELRTRARSSWRTCARTETRLPSDKRREQNFIDFCTSHRIRHVAAQHGDRIVAI